MDQFLTLQQDVVQAFLTGSPPAVAAPIPSVAPAMAAPLAMPAATLVEMPAATVDEVTAALPVEPVPPAIGALLLQIVSDKTGYPAEMLDLNLDLEADLG